jgi:hypothetical protein
MQVYYPVLYCYYQVALTNVPSGNDITNASYKGWCADTSTSFKIGVVLAAYAYSSYDSHAPIPSGEWDKINYILNHKRYADQMEIQNAIWIFIDSCHDDAVLTPTSQALVDAANQNGEGFVPTQGQILAVVLCPVKDYEKAIIEVRMPPDVVVPEFEFGTIVGLVGFFAALGIFRFRRRTPRLPKLG